MTTLLALVVLGAARLASPSAYPPLVNLFTQLDSRLPHGQYRIPSLVTTLKGTLLAFVAGRMHRTDRTPDI